MLALLSGAIMLVMGAARLGFLANFLSHPVISGFVSASGLLIAASQLKHLLGVPLQGDNLLQLLPQLWHNLPSLHVPTSAMGLGALGLLLLVRRQLKPWLKRLGVPAGTADLAAKAAPVAVLDRPMDSGPGFVGARFADFLGGLCGVGVGGSVAGGQAARAHRPRCRVACAGPEQFGRRPLRRLSCHGRVFALGGQF
jgi:hypothetical protein